MAQSFDLLDLTIELTTPPEETPADVLASVTVRCDALGIDHAAGLLTDPLTVLATWVIRSENRSIENKYPAKW